MDAEKDTAAAASAPAKQLSHIDSKGHARMVDVSAKADTVRTAVAEGYIWMHPDTLAMIVEGRAPKGDVFATARVAGIMGAKQASSLIPMCHPLPITDVEVGLEPVGVGTCTDDASSNAGGRCGIHVVVRTKVISKTGIEMEALTGASIACLTIYDMCKAVDRGMEISGVRLLLKDGGKSGLWCREGVDPANVEGSLQA